MASPGFPDSPDFSKLKLLKQDSDLASDYFPNDEKNHQKIKSITIVYKKIEYDGDPKRICRISVKGCKYVSRVIASGEFTIEILDKIRKSSAVKMIRRVDFDPYLCETSGLKSLYQVLKKFKGLLSCLNLTFRRFTLRDELKEFCPCMGRLNKINKINIEFPNPQGMDLQDLDDFTNFAKRLSVKSARVSFSG